MADNGNTDLRSNYHIERLVDLIWQEKLAEEVFVAE